MAKIHSIEAALEQLDTAIRLFMDEQSYISAITLSGAAAGIFEGLNQSTFKGVIKRLEHKFELSEKNAADHLNQVRNFLKHAHPNAALHTDFDPQLEAALMIIRAIASYEKTPSSVATVRMNDFSIWQAESGIFKDTTSMTNDLA